MTAATLTLAEFLLARIAEECGARRADCRLSTGGWCTDHSTSLGPVYCAEINRTGEPALRVAARCYADHPDYDPAWR